jgi:uncharacterized protein (TIGR02246 family)
VTQRSLAALGTSLVAVLALGLVIGIGKMPAKSDEPNAEEKPAPGKGKRAKEFIAAFEREDAAAVAAFWTPEGEYVDEDGNVTKGREALEKLYKEVFSTRKHPKLHVEVTSHREITSDVALEKGFTEVTDESGPPVSAAFSAVLVKKDGEWYFESVRESFARAPSNAEHFKDIEWLIGDWTSGTKKGEGSNASYSWAEGGNFIVSTFATTINGFPVVGGTQWIAWDAADKRVRSWSFYSRGGFGEAEWSHDGKTWTLNTTARTRDGKKASATNIITKVDDDHATWQLTKLTIDGKELPDPPPQKLMRVKE